jgi:hypothetical protein
MKSNRAKILVFLIGTNVSVFGSLLFTVSAISALIEEGQPLSFISAGLGFVRLVPILLLIAFSGMIDRVSPRKTLILFEGISAMASLAIAILWWMDRKLALEFVFQLMCLRAAGGWIVQNLRTKLLKSLDSIEELALSKNVVRFNQATQGATFLAGTVSLVIKDAAPFISIVIFDTITFVFGIICLFMLGQSDSEAKAKKSPHYFHSLYEGFQALYLNGKHRLLAEIVLSISLGGLWSLNNRLYHGISESPALGMITFGAATWLTGAISLRSKTLFYPLLLLSLVQFAIAYLYQVDIGPIWMFLVLLLRDFCYWVAIHRLTWHWQLAIPTEMLGRALGVRILLTATILAIFEWVGVFSPSAGQFPTELVLRGMATLLALYFLWKK